MIRINSNKVLNVSLLLMVLGLSYSCSTKKNTFTRRVYHNLTGHYNMFWNGRESFREGVDQLQNSVEDNYNKTLLVFNYGTEQDAQSLNPYMDKAIEKASINIQRHSMYFNRREYVRWIDDSYMLIGKSYFYKQEYNKARRTFEFVINEYKYNSIRFEAMLWLAKSYNQLGKYKRARSALDNLRNEIDKTPGDVPKKVRQGLPLVAADMLLQQEKFSQAKEPLIDALYLRQKRDMDARVRFILGQIYQQEEEFYRASEYYRQVIKKRPPYEMAFNAAINLARSYDTRYGEDSRDIEKNLQKMLKEDKNSEYLDQIYYALADVAFKNGNDSLAIVYLTASVANSVSNDYQKATSALALGDIYFEVPEYELAQAYYDTAVQVIPEDYPNKEDIELRTMYLTELVQNLVVVNTEDSLQRVAAMSEEERVALIENIIEELKKEEERQRELEELARLSGQTGLNAGQSTIQTGAAGSGQWYFYNSSALSYGFSEFKKKWGNRKLEDNWRLSNKEAIFEAQEEEQPLVGEIPGDSTIVDSTGAVVAVASNDPHTIDYYLKDLPFTEDQLAASNAKIEEALFNLGMIYKDKLENYPRAVESFESMNERFPDNENKLQSYYHLYRIFTVQENFDRATHYKNLIVENYPDSDYAKLLTDPDYFKELEAEKNRVRILYSETYEHYEAGHYYTVFSNSTRALEEFTEPAGLLSKFAYLRALSLGKIEVVDSLQAALDSLVVKYPDSDVVPLAQNILDYLKGPIDTTSAPKEPEEVIDFSIYEFNPKSKQIYALVVNGPSVNVNALKVRISDFNTKFYNLDNLSITSILLNKTTHFVMVGNFETINGAMRYYNSISDNEYVFSNLENAEYNGFVIAQENYPVFYKDKDVKKYLAFFRENYLSEN